MTKLRFLFLFPIGLSLSVQAQKTDSLVGKWKYYDIYNKQIYDTNTLKIAKEYFSGMTFYFKANNHYKALVMNNPDEGVWSMNESTSKVRLTSYKGHSNESKILALNDDKLILSIGEGAFIMTRTNITESDNIEQPLPEIKTVAATKSQISKKWFLQRREVPGRSEAQVKMASKLIKGAYAHFKQNGEYEAQSLKVTESGKWVFGPDNKSIIVTIDSQQRIWNIKSISPTQLVLISGYTEELWKFSTKLL
ncbi:lipocalin family protein [Longitalea arenae]|uniref:lipocalin family protein n=1 Tax=Longitalea arenae TaxID=2812558 RepID=UPI00196790A1|nr:lipocalin family protein [Longitalea arenae]